ncbi:MAG: 6,7-dimethyl-8-ribityllumazine synthase [Phycisphaerales bacterium]|nr:6,7-dimethyl-8-ribityllumazine synthase [Phycisphaerales bacterium]
MRDAPNIHLDAQGLKIGIVTSCYHEEITSKLREGAISAFTDAGGDPDDIYEVTAPGAFEIIPLVDALARKDLDGVVALGCIIRGETTHDEHLARSISKMLAHIAFDHEMGIGFGVLTCLSTEQAMDRSGGIKGNKGEEAMNAVIATARALEVIEEDLPDLPSEEDDSDEEYEEVIEYEYVDEDPDEEEHEEDAEGEYEYEEEDA